MNKILLFGSQGQLGWELQRTLAPLGKVTAVDLQELDISQPDAIRAFMNELSPDIVVNAAAYTAVDKAEDQQDIAQTINATAPRIMAEEAQKHQALFVHYSTDYVFDGKAQEPYSEKDIPSPLGVYGKTKLAGDQAVQEIGGRFLIFRTSWVYGLRGANFLKTMIRLATERDELGIVSDQIGTPTWCRMLAESTTLALHQTLSTGDKEENFGIYNVSGSGQTSWFEFAGKIITTASQKLHFQPPTIKPIATADYPTKSPRPAYSVLDNSLFEKTFGLEVADWQDQLELCLNDLPSHYLIQK